MSDPRKYHALGNAGLARRIARIALGVLLLIAGIIGIILPVVPQIPFLIGAGLLLAPDIPPVRRLMNRCFRKWPKLRGAVPKKLRGLTKRPPA